MQLFSRGIRDCIEVVIILCGSSFVLELSLKIDRFVRKLHFSATSVLDCNY